jgi:uncharacterized protein YjiS (DUF1127 family)
MNKFFSTLVRSQQRRSTLRYLQGMDDRMLRDIGVTRDDLPALMAGSARSAN